jgi:hypothetical protein
MATKFFIGIPWHGYDYKCSDYEVNVQNNITFSEEISVWVRLDWIIQSDCKWKDYIFYTESVFVLTHLPEARDK